MSLRTVHILNSIYQPYLIRLNIAYLAEPKRKTDPKRLR